MKDGNRLKLVLSFLRRTRDGEYAPIEETSLAFTRIAEEIEQVYLPEDDCYYYSIG